MMKNTLFAAAAALLAIACTQNKAYSPVMGEVEEVIQTTCPEISGLILCPDGDGWYAASDENGIWHIARDGKSVPVWTQKDLDCEGITIDPKTKDIYYVVEGRQELCRLKAPDYKDSETLLTLSDIAFDTNHGLEGLTWYKKDIVYIGNQYDPVEFIKYSVKQGRILSRTTLDGTAEIGGLFYDPKTDHLWIMDSFKFFIRLCTPDGEVLQSYPIPFIANAECCCVDHANSCLWVGDDETGQIYKIRFYNL